jgi:DNA-binding response OmpR family regulator
MPDEDGFWLARALRDAGVTTPLIAVSGLADLDTRTRALRAGFTAHLAKPTDPQMLVEAIRRTVSG